MAHFWLILREKYINQYSKIGLQYLNQGALTERFTGFTSVSPNGLQAPDCFVNY